MSELAILGGPAAVTIPLLQYNSIGEKERQAVAEVMQSGCLSAFYGSWDENFLGGPKVREFEAAWAERFGSRHAVSVNSNTSGLFAAMGAVGVSPGDEIILPATTMSATAVAPLIYGGIPVFADIEDDTFCIDVDSVQANLSDKTKAVIAVNLFGHPARLHELRTLCDARGIFLVEDNAQAVLGTEHGRNCGTIGHIGVFSLNYHKHIHTGEGGVCTTDDDELANRLQMIRNHAEAVAGPAGVTDLCNLVGFNFRMTELSAAVGLAQLEDVKSHVARRQAIGRRLNVGIAGLDGLTVPTIRDGCEHAFYNWTLRYDEDVLGVPRSTFTKALIAEGFPCYEGYVRPLYQLPLFQHRMAIGREGFPFTLSERKYETGMCPVAERLYEREIITLQCCAYQVDDALTEQFVLAVRKVHRLCEQLQERSKSQAAGAR